MLLFCMKEKTPPMAHQPSTPESHENHQIPPQPLKSKTPHQLKGKKMGQDHDGSQYLEGLVSDSRLRDSESEDSGRERLKRHRVEVAAGRVWIPDIWGQEELLKDWIDCAAFDAPLVPSRIVMARAALVEEGRRATSSGFRIENRC